MMMFTGIIEEIGEVASLSKTSEGLKISVKAGKVLGGAALGDSISVNGVCLTVIDLGRDHFCVEAGHESLDRSTLKDLKVNSRVNLERAMRADKRFGGHFVLGHVDGVGRIIGARRIGRSVDLKITCPTQLMKYIIEKGSIAVDGVSLTVSLTFASGFGVSIIPFTFDNTGLVSKRVGDDVNIEVDALAKLVHVRVGAIRGSRSKIDENFLREHGFIS